MQHTIELLNLLKSFISEKFGDEFSVYCYKRDIFSPDPKPQCPISGDLDGIPKKNAWIVFLTDEKNHIVDLEVYEMDRNNEYRCEKTLNYVVYKLKEKKVPYLDFGNVYADWDQWTLSDILFKLGWQYGFYDQKIMIKCLRNLNKISEFKEELSKYLCYVQ